MTFEELVDLVKNGPTDKLLAGLAPLTESERKKLSKTAVSLRKELIPREMGPILHDNNSPTLLRVKLALLGLGPLGEAQRIRIWHLVPAWQDKHNHRQMLFHVLRDRKPDWILQWVEKELEQRDDFPDWVLIRRLIREGVCPKPQSEAYILKALLQSFRYCDRQKTLKENLLADSDLLQDEVWRIFDLAPVNGTIISGTDITDAAASAKAGFDASSASWGYVLADLCREGKLDRQRLLSASLHSLTRNTEALNTVWFCRFHELLEPTAEERFALQTTYLQLLSHPVPGVAELALDALGVLEKTKQLDVAALLDSIGPVFHLQPKVQPLAAVKLLGKLLAANRERAPKVAEGLLAALCHPAPQVQEAVVQLLGKVSAEAGDIIAAQLPGQLELLAPSLRERARALIVGNIVEAPSTAAVESADLLAEARRVPAPWREAAGIDALLLAIEQNGDLPPMAFDPMAVPRLYDDQRVEPIQTLDDLIERLTVAIEGLDDPIEFELLIDGLSRLCDQRPDDFEARTAPLLRRIEKLLPAHPSIVINLTTGGLRFALFNLILRWCDREVRETRVERDSVLGFLDIRLSLVSLRLRKRQAAPLLACPTHRSGWIDPGEFARRLEEHQRLGVEPSQHDFIEAILRLAPDHRADTMNAASTLQGKYAPAFRYALGGPLEDTPLSFAVLTATGRARAPLAALSELAHLPADGPDMLRPARYSWQVNHSDAESKTHWARLYVSVEPRLPTPELARDLPNVLLHRVQHQSFSWDGLVGVNRWMSMVWPANLDAYFAVGARIHAGQYSQTSLLRQRATFLEPLFDANVPFSEMAQLHLALCLSEQVPEVTGLAVDALVELIQDGRCVGKELGGVFARMLPGGLIKLNRLGKQLETAARASVLHAHVCAEIVQASCAGLTEIPRDLHHLLGPLLEWLSALEQRVQEELRPLLEKAASGKTGSLAKKLLQLRPNPGKRREVLFEALRGRLQRAERWARSNAAGE